MYKLSVIVLILADVCCSIASNTTTCRLHPLQHLIDQTCPVEFDEQCDERFDVSRPTSNKLVCGRRRRVGFFVDDQLEIVHIINSTLLSELVNRRTSTGAVTSVDEPWCMLTNFYSSTCPFSTRLAPYYNALPRVFPRLLVVAIDASDYSNHKCLPTHPTSQLILTNFSRLNSRYGITGTPCLILWHNGIAVARYDDIDYSLTALTAFISQWTDLAAARDVDVTDVDLVGPLSSGGDESIDYVLIVAWAFIAYAIGYYGSRSRVARRLWNAMCTNFREANE